MTKYYDPWSGKYVDVPDKYKYEGYSLGGYDSTGGWLSDKNGVPLHVDKSTYETHKKYLEDKQKSNAANTNGATGNTNTEPTNPPAAGKSFYN